jgi:hypothetical protein
MSVFFKADELKCLHFRTMSKETWKLLESAGVAWIVLCLVIGYCHRDLAEFYSMSAPGPGTRSSPYFNLEVNNDGDWMSNCHLCPVRSPLGPVECSCQAASLSAHVCLRRKK